MDEFKTLCENIFKMKFVNSTTYIQFEDDIYNDLPLNIFNFNVRTSNILNRNNIFYLSELLNYNYLKLSKIRGFGTNSLDLLEIALQDKIKVIENENINLNKPIISSKIAEDNEKIYFGKENTVFEEIFCKKFSHDKFTFRHMNIDYNKDILLENFDLSVRTSNCLLRNNILSLYDLLNYNFEKLKSLKNMGATSVSEILDFIKCGGRITPISLLKVNDYRDKLESIYNNLFVEENSSKEDILNLIFMYLKERELLELNKEDILENYSIQILDNDSIIEIINNQILSFVNELYQKNGIGPSKSEAIKICVIKNIQLKYAIVEKLIESNILFYFDEKLYISSCSVFDYIETLDERSREVISYRFEGETLEEISTVFNITRERVRQIIKKQLYKNVVYDEDLYRIFFEDYTLSKVDFIYIFGITEQIYNYLSARYSAKESKYTINNIIDNEKFSLQLRLRAEEALYKDFIKIDTAYVKNNRLSILEHYLKIYCKEPVNIEKIAEDFLNFVDKNNIVFTDENMYSIRYFESNLANHKKILWQRKKICRYYDTENYDMDNFFTNLNLALYANTEIGALKIFNSNKNLMDEYDIQNEYELHNLLKKHIDDETLKSLEIEFSRMPIIKFGNYSRDQQAYDLLAIYAPISRADYAKLYEEEYGVRSESVIANFTASIDKYLVDGIFILNLDNDDNETLINEADKVKDLLNEEFYFIEDAINLIKKANKILDKSKINTYLLRLLGYKIFSNYIVLEKYQGATDYFRKKYSTDFLDLRDEDNRLSYIMARNLVIKDLEINLDIIEFEPKQYISFNRFFEIDITKEKLLDFSNKAIIFAKDDIFTLQSLKNEGFYHELFELGFDDYFYSSLIRIRNEIFAKKHSGTMLFRKNKSIAILDLINFLMDKFEQIDIYDFVYYIKKEYSIEVEKYKILEAIKESNFFYSPIMEKVYLNYDLYYEEV